MVESLLPLTLLDQMLSLLTHSRRLIIYGGAGIGKSNLSRHLVRYLALQLRVDKEQLFEVHLSEDGAEATRQVSLAHSYAPKHCNIRLAKVRVVLNAFALWTYSNRGFR